MVAGDIVYCSAGYGVGAGAVKVANADGGWTATEIYRIKGDKPLEFERDADRNFSPSPGK